MRQSSHSVANQIGGLNAAARLHQCAPESEGTRSEPKCTFGRRHKIGGSQATQQSCDAAFWRFEHATQLRQAEWSRASTKGFQNLDDSRDGLRRILSALMARL